MKTKMLLLVAVLTSSAIFSQKKWTLKQCVDHALEKNLNVQQNKLNIDVAKANVKDSKGNFLPTLSGSTGANVNFNPITNGFSRLGTSSTLSGSVGLSSGVTLYAGQRNKNSLKQAELNVKGSELDLEQTKNTISLNVVNAFLNVWVAKENLSVAKTQSEISNKQIERAKTQFNQGAIPKTDLLNVQSTAANDAQTVVIRENAVNLALLNLAQLLQIPVINFDVDEIVAETPSVALLYENSNEVYKKALTFRPEIERSKLNIENSKINVAIAKSAYLPTVTASADAGMSYGYGLGDSNNASNYALLRQFNNSFNYGAGVSVSIPIFNGFKTDASVEQAKINQNINEVALESQKLQLEQIIEQAYLDAKLAANTYKVAQTSLAAQEEAFKNAQESYNFGAMNQFDFDQVRSRLVLAQGNVIAAKYDYIFKTKVLKFYFGENITE